MKHRYRILKGAETVDCTGCKWARYNFNSRVAPCRLCAGARLDSERNYYKKGAKK